MLFPITAVFLLTIIIPFQFANNIRIESNNLDTWLHTPVSFKCLLFSKIAFYLLTTAFLFILIAINVLVFIRIKLNTSVIDFIPIVFTTISLLWLFLFTFLLLMLLVLALYLYLKRYIGRFAYIISFLSLTLFMWIALKIGESTLFVKYFYSGTNLINYIAIPENYHQLIKLELMDFFFVKELVITTLVYLIIGYIGMKSLERVLKR